jgi:hypothetical protein
MDFIEPIENIFRGFTLNTKIPDHEDQRRHQFQISDGLPTHGLIDMKKELLPSRESSIINH